MLQYNVVMGRPFASRRFRNCGSRSCALNEACCGNMDMATGRAKAREPVMTASCEKGKGVGCQMIAGAIRVLSLITPCNTTNPPRAPA